jgi:hypothetical protein
MARDCRRWAKYQSPIKGIEKYPAIRHHKVDRSRHVFINDEVLSPIKVWRE